MPRSETDRQGQTWAADAQLSQAAAQGDIEAQRELLLRALPVARRTARYLLGSSHDLEDAVQTTLLAVLRGAGRFRGCSSLVTWVSRIATRTTLRLVRAQRRLVPMETIEALPALERADAAACEAPRKIWHYLEQLPEPQRVALVLRYMLDYRVNDIVDATASPSDTVKYRLKEGLAKVRRMIRQDLAARAGTEARPCFAPRPLARVA